MTIDDSLRRDLLTSSTGTPHKNKANKTTPLDLDQLIVSSSKQVLLKKIDFQPAEQEVSFCLQNLRGKYVPVNSSKERVNPGMVPVSNQGSMSKLENGKPDGIPNPKHVLFHPEKIRLEWQKCHRIGVGLINMGNTCFLNSTLQCLSYTPPLANYLLSHQHKEQCQMSGFCMLCELYNHLVRIGQHHGQAVRPMVIIHKLKHIAKHMHLGRQEDAHEFLRYVIEAMQRSCTSGYDKLDKFSKETSIVHQIFGGYYRSRVTCSLCQAISDTYDPFLDIGLDIKHVPSVNKALDRLIRPEMLDGDNKYKCARCKRQVAAQKKFTIHRSSNVLTLCLKKFDFQRFGSGKLHKDISYPETINIRPYMSDTKGPAVLYNLYAVLTHQGASCNSGHYFCFVRAPNKMWYCMNDAHVSQASLSRVMNQDAYLLFYIRKPQGSTSGHKNGPKQNPKSRISGPFTQTSGKSQSLANSQNGGFMGKKSEVQTSSVTIPKSSPRPQPPVKPSPKPAPPSSSLPPVKKEPLSFVQTATTPFKSSTFQAPSKAMPLPSKREKLSFSIKSQGVAGTLQTLKKQQQMRSELNQEPLPSGGRSGGGDKGKRIGQKTKLEHPVKPKAMNAWGDTPQGGLVPYAADDSSESDSDENYDDVAKRLSQQAPRSSGSGQPSTSTSGSTSGSTNTSTSTSGSTGASSSTNTSTSTSGGDTSTTTTDAEAKAKEDANVASLADSTDLTAIQSHDSPLKLTITTNGNAQRIKSTSTWHVNHSDTLISPSINSESSTGSVSSNSTQEWNVTDRQKDSSRSKSRKESNGAGKSSHKHAAFPVIAKSGKPDVVDRVAKGAPGEMKSPAMRQLSFVKDVTNDGDRPESRIETSSVMKGSVKGGLNTQEQIINGPESSQSQNQHSSVERKMQNTSAKSPDGFNEAVPCSVKNPPDSFKGGNFRIAEKKQQRESDWSSSSTAFGKPGKSEDAGSVGLQTVKRDETTNSTNNEGVAPPVGATPHPEKSTIVTEKITKHKNKRKKRKNDSESDKEKLLSDSEDRQNQPNCEDYEWYVVANEDGHDDEDSASKKKKRKRKRKQRDDKEDKSEEDCKRVDNATLDEEEVITESWERGKEMGRYREKRPIDSDSDRENVSSKKISKANKKDYSQLDSFKQNGRKTCQSSDDDDDHSDGSAEHTKTMDSNRYRIHGAGKARLRATGDHKAKKRKRKDRDGDRKMLLEDSEDEEDEDEERYSSHRKQKYFPPGEMENGQDRDESRDAKQYHKRRKDVQEQSWDHHIKDNYKKSYQDKNNSTGSSSWDGRWKGSDDVVRHLTKSSFGGYGSQVKSWGGGKSLVDEEAERDSRLAKQRDSYNEEFDSGKVKKVKKKPEDDTDRYGRGYHGNPFQHYQSSKNKGRSPFWNRRHSSSSSSYHRFGHNKPHSWRTNNWR